MRREVRAAEGQRLDVFLSTELGITRSRVKNLIEDGRVTVNGKEVKAGYMLRNGETVAADIPEDKPLEAVAQDLPVNIVYQDEDFAVIDKEQGMVVHPAAGNRDGTLVNALLARLDNLSSINGVVRPGIVHRLDKMTSGLLVVAKNDAAHKSLAAQIASKEAERRYIALVDGNVREDEGKIEASIARSRKDRKKMAVDSEGKKAVTLYRVLERLGKYTLVEFSLKTGRTHQIRVHCKHIGHPVVGDETYGGSNAFKLKGQLLHAYRLSFDHPTTGERKVFDSPLPAYFTEVLKKLNSAYTNNK